MNLLLGYPHGPLCGSNYFLIFLQCRRTWAALHFHLLFWALLPLSASIFPAAINSSSFLGPPTIVAAISLLKLKRSITRNIFSSSISAGFTDVIRHFPIRYAVRRTAMHLLALSILVFHCRPSFRTSGIIVEPGVERIV